MCLLSSWFPLLPLASAVIYWGGVGLRAWQVKSHIGHSPNLLPRSTQEKFLWLGWALVVVTWAGASHFHTPPLFKGPVSSGVGALLIFIGLAGTSWSHSSLGDAWRIGVREGEKTALITAGPYRRVRHPLYSFQILILLGVFLIAPSVITFSGLILHRFLVSLKIRDEEKHLERLHGPIYKEYAKRTGTLWPKV